MLLSIQKAFGQCYVGSFYLTLLMYHSPDLKVNPLEPPTLVANSKGPYPSEALTDMGNVPKS
jgi:hypothetical protein